MKSQDVVAFGAPLEPAQRATPQPTGSEVLLKVIAAGVCHSDLHLWEGHYDLGSGRKLEMSTRGIRPPFTMGHEIVGEVVAVGSEAGEVQEGARRVVFPWIGCGRCPACLRDEENLCSAPQCLGIHKPGGYADHVLVPHPRYLVDIGDLEPDQAALYACSGLTTFSALKKVGTALKTAPIAIIGAGGLGLMCLSVHKAMGGHGAVIVDIDPVKLDAARAAGAIGTVNAAKEGAAELAAAAPNGFAAVIDFVGSASTAQLGIDVLPRGGRYILVGLFGGELTLSLPLLPLRGITIQGSYTGSLGELRELIALARSMGVPKVPVTRSPLDQANAVLESLRAGRLIGRGVLRPQD